VASIVGNVGLPRMVIGHLPASPFHVAICLQLVCQEASSPSPVLTAVYSIDWVHKLSGYEKVSVHPFVESMMSACQRILARPKCRKEPITAEMLHALALKFKDKSSVSDVRTLAMCLIGFAGFFRFNELCIPFVPATFSFIPRTVLFS